MSLINDALKRATQAQPATKPAPEMETTMKPAPPPRTVGPARLFHARPFVHHFRRMLVPRQRVGCPSSIRNGREAS
jgi:hypothetical protein